MAKLKKISLTHRIFMIFGILATACLGMWGYHKYLEKQKVDNLYRHGFQLLEEQIATYIVEHYSGVSKVEFSPIFMSGGGSQSFLNLDVVTAIYDNHGNKALLSGKIGDRHYDPDGLWSGIEVLDFDDEGNEKIYLSQSAKGGEIDVSGHEHLPKEAKLSSSKTTDEIIASLVQEGKLKKITRDAKGSPEAEISYNLEIKRGDYTAWP